MLLIRYLRLRLRPEPAGYRYRTANPPPLCQAKHLGTYLIFDGHLARAKQYFSVCVSVLGKNWQVPFPRIAAVEVLGCPPLLRTLSAVRQRPIFLWWGLLREGPQILDSMGFGLTTLYLDV